MLFGFSVFYSFNLRNVPINRLAPETQLRLANFRFTHFLQGMEVIAGYDIKVAFGCDQEDSETLPPCFLQRVGVDNYTANFQQKTFVNVVEGVFSRERYSETWAKWITGQQHRIFRKSLISRVGWMTFGVERDKRQSDGSSSLIGKRETNFHDWSTRAEFLASGNNFPLTRVYPLALSTLLQSDLRLQMEGLTPQDTESAERDESPYDCGFKVRTIERILCSVVGLFFVLAANWCLWSKRSADSDSIGWFMLGTLCAALSCPFLNTGLTGEHLWFLFAGCK